MRAISLIVVHCSATREDKSFTEHDLDVCHRRRGFNGEIEPEEWIKACPCFDAEKCWSEE